MPFLDSCIKGVQNCGTGIKSGFSRCFRSIMTKSVTFWAVLAPGKLLASIAQMVSGTGVSVKYYIEGGGDEKNGNSPFHDGVSSTKLILCCVTGTAGAFTTGVTRLPNLYELVFPPDTNPHRKDFSLSDFSCSRGVGISSLFLVVAIIASCSGAGSIFFSSASTWNFTRSLEDLFGWRAKETENSEDPSNHSVFIDTLISMLLFLYCLYITLPAAASYYASQFKKIRDNAKTACDWLVNPESHYLPQDIKQASIVILVILFSAINTTASSLSSYYGSRKALARASKDLGIDNLMGGPMSEETLVFVSELSLITMATTTLLTATPAVIKWMTKLMYGDERKTLSTDHLSEKEKKFLAVMKFAIYFNGLIYALANGAVASVSDAVLFRDLGWEGYELRTKKSYVTSIGLASVGFIGDFAFNVWEQGDQDFENFVKRFLKLRAQQYMSVLQQPDRDLESGAMPSASLEMTRSNAANRSRFRYEDRDELMTEKANGSTFRYENIDEIKTEEEESKGEEAQESSSLLSLSITAGTTVPDYSQVQTSNARDRFYTSSSTVLEVSGSRTSASTFSSSRTPTLFASPTSPLASNPLRGNTAAATGYGTTAAPESDSDRDELPAFDF